MINPLLSGREIFFTSACDIPWRVNPSVYKYEFIFIGERERANLVVQLARFFYTLRAPIPNKRNVNVILQCWISDLGKRRRRMRTVRKSATYTVAVHFSQCVPYCYSWLQSILYTANMESVDGTTPSTVSHTARNR